jgi:hypothetical protein
MMTSGRVVRVTLYNKAGERFALPEITLAPSETRFLDIRESIPPERIGTFSEGSVEVYFHGPGMAIGSQLAVTDERHNRGFDVLLREDANFSSSRLDSLWLSLDNQTTVDVFVTNTRPFPTTVTPTVYVNGKALTGESLTLDSHMAETIDVGSLLKKLGVRRGIAAGGISLQHNGQPGAIVVAGVIGNKQRGFSSTMRFVDISKQGSTTLHGANVLIGQANSEYQLPNDAKFTPRAVVRNTSGAPVEVKARARYTTDDRFDTVELQPLTLSANEVRELDLSSIIATLSGKQVINAGFELEHDSGPGSVIAALLSVDESGNHVFDVPLKDPRSVRNVGGNYPWRIDGHNRAVAHIKNIDPVIDGAPREFAVMITTTAGKYSFPVQLTQAGETAAIDIRKLRDEQIKDNHGNVIPLDITEGQIEWYGRGPLGQFIGRLVQYNPATGVSNSLGCETFCDCEPIYISSRVTPTSISGVPGNTFELRAWETDQRCDGSTYECEVYATFNPDLPTVVEVNNAAFPRIATLGNDGGTAVIQGTWQVPGPSCGTTLPVFHSIQVQNIKVDIFLSSTKITDTTTNVIVGQQISLSAAVNPPITIQSPQWTIPGTRIGNYVVTYTNPTSATSGVVTQLTTANLSQSSITFYWVDGGENREVKYSFTSGGKSYSGKATFNVKRPTVEVTTVTGTVVVAQPFGQLELVYGNVFIPGIKFTRANLSIPMGFSGDTYWVQVANVTRTRRRNDGTDDIFTGSGLDNRFSYSVNDPNATQTNDSPGLALTSDYTNASVTDSYQMWLMFKPSSTGSIYVPLRKVDWSWSGTATRSGSQWTLTNSSNTQNPASADSTTHPTWTTNANVDTTP